MSEIWILVIQIVVFGGQNITMQEFANKDSCNNAIYAIMESRAYQRGSYYFICVPKDIKNNS